MYKVLSKPISPMAPNNYKGLYRSEPFPHSSNNKRYIDLWERYVKYLEPLVNMGITNELSLEELDELAEFASKETKDIYEVIQFSESINLTYQAQIYGFDVVGLGGYSMIGDGCFEYQETMLADNHWGVIVDIYSGKTNQYGLFDRFDDADSFCKKLIELQLIYPSCLEQEDWRIVSICTPNRNYS